MEDLTRFRVGYVPGVMPGKWERIWSERERTPLELVLTEDDEALDRLRDGSLAMCLVRGSVDKDVFHLIPLYAEQPVVVASAEHPVAAYDEIEVAELADEYDVLANHPDITVKQAIETAAAGTGIVIVPMSLARLHHRKDAVWRPVRGVEESRVGLAWLKQLSPELENVVQAFIGVVRGRTVNSSR